MTQTIDITKMSVTELKAMAYDLVIEKDQINQNLATIGNEILMRQKQDQKPVEMQ